MDKISEEVVIGWQATPQEHCAVLVEFLSRRYDTV